MKPTFAKLGLKINNAVKTVVMNDQEIEIKQYLPINEKLMLVSKVINQSADENNFANPMKLDVFTKLEIIFYYTNLTFTYKQKEDLVNLYDLMERNRIFDLIFDQMDEQELNNIFDSVDECAKAIYAYKNSIMGVLEMAGQDYHELDMNALDIKEKLADPSNLTLLKDIMTKLG